MKNLFLFCKRLLKEESGQAISEYSAVLALVALAVALLVGSSGCYRQELSRSFRNAASQVQRMTKKSSSSLPIQPYHFIG
jgi:Flp pilus assembly pilin Flp